jgi:Holliday junction resolvasome RuvABC endonuclease subunit
VTALTLPETPAAPAAGAPALRILALDLSVTATGVCLPDGTTHTITTNPKDGDRRLQRIVDHVGVALGEGSDGRHDDVDLVVIEGPVVRSSAAVIIGMVHGAVRLHLIDSGTPYVLITPATLKAYATGKGNADKTAMAIAALKRTGREFADDNQCDAWWLRAAALDWYGRPEFDLPKVQRERLTKVVWPALTAVTG